MNKQYRDIRRLFSIELLIIPVFVFFKFIRPGVLKSDAPEIFKTILLSLPNFFEAVVGTLTLTGIGLVLNDRLLKKRQLIPPFIYILAVFLAGTYVILRELNIIRTRAITTMDPNDIIFSIIGLITAYSIVRWISPRIKNEVA